MIRGQFGCGSCIGPLAGIPLKKIWRQIIVLVHPWLQVASVATSGRRMLFYCATLLLHQLFRHIVQPVEALEGPRGGGNVSGMPVDCRSKCNKLLTARQPTYIYRSKAQRSSLFVFSPYSQIYKAEFHLWKVLAVRLSAFEVPRALSGTMRSGVHFLGAMPDTSARSIWTATKDQNTSDNGLLPAPTVGVNFDEGIQVPATAFWQDHLESNTRTWNLVIPFDVIFRSSTKYRNPQNARRKLV